MGDDAIQSTRSVRSLSFELPFRILLRFDNTACFVHEEARYSCTSLSKACFRRPQGRARNGVQSSAGGSARFSVVSKEGECSKSNISSSGLACSSRFVRCWVTPLMVKNRRSIKASSEVWSPIVCETYRGFENGEMAISGTRIPN